MRVVRRARSVGHYVAMALILSAKCGSVPPRVDTAYGKRAVLGIAYYILLALVQSYLILIYALPVSRNPYGMLDVDPLSLSYNSFPCCRSPRARNADFLHLQ